MAGQLPRFARKGGKQCQAIREVRGTRRLARVAALERDDPCGHVAAIGGHAGKVITCLGREAGSLVCDVVRDYSFPV
jgi:hypothetical protein